MDVSFTPQIRRQFKKLPSALQEEALEKIELFKKNPADPMLRVHKLKGEIAGRMSFSVNYRFRIIFMWETPHESAILLAIGDHALYD